ncbi:MAG: cupin domain-containing protein [Opitutales bacterium]
MSAIVHTAELPWLPKTKPGVEEPLGEFKALWQAHGCDQFEVRLTRIPPHGGTSTRYHTHTLEEEWFFVLQGTCHICLEGTWHALQPRDSIFKRCGAFHTFRNFGDKPCELLMLGSNVDGSETRVADEPPPPERA